MLEPRPKDRYRFRCSVPTADYGLVIQYGRDIAEAKRNMIKKLKELTGKDVDLNSLALYLDQVGEDE